MLLGVTGCSDSSDSADASSSNVTLNFVTAHEADASVLRTVSPTEDYCQGNFDEPGGFQTQQCWGTPVGFDLGVLAIYLLDCIDTDGASVVCGSADLAEIGTRYTLYEGDQVDVPISDVETAFSEALETVSTTMNVGGIQIVTAYIQQTFPDSGTEADKIDETLQGTSYRICLAPHDEIDGATLLTNCGASDVHKGDYLIDVDDVVSGYGYIDMDSLTADSLTETATRPEGYDSFNDSTFASSGVCFGTEVAGCELEYTTEDFYPVVGYFAPIMGLNEVIEVSESSEVTFTVSFDIDDTFAWTDGADGEIPSDQVCVQAITDEVCAEDADPESVGVYNVFYDTAFLPEMPHVTVTAE
jgi:hypothetical protein